MKLNIFQKIAFLVYISIIVLICVYFVPYQNNDNYTFHSSIMSDGYGTMSYFRFLIYLIVPTISFYFVCKYLETMSSLESNVYKKKAKKELYVFFFFVSIIAGTILFSYGKNEYSEIRKKRLENQISEINNSFNILKEELNKRPPLDLSGAQDILKENVDEYGIKIKKPIEKLNLDLNGYYYETYKKNVDEVLKKTSNVGLSVIRRKQLETNIKELINNGSSFDDLNKMIVDYVEMFSENGIKKIKFELELREITVYNKEEIQKKIIFMFLISFILFYVIRPLFSTFKEMLKEVN